MAIEPDQIREVAEAKDWPITLYGEVDEQHAAPLCRWAYNTLKNRRLNLQPVPKYRRDATGHYWYSFEAIAEWLNQKGTEADFEE